jgi:hypothetical protein
MLDLFCGRWGWSRAFAARGWECVGVDWIEPSEIPKGCEFLQCNVLDLRSTRGNIYLGSRQLGQWNPDFICASSPCEQFSVHGMKHFHPNPPYPELGIKLFNHTREICEASGVPYVMENVRAAQQFVGQAVHHCGPFYLWGNGVPPLLNQGVTKGFTHGAQRPAHWPHNSKGSALAATIPIELSNCVADYAERILVTA